jgi:hypothetical protein
MMLPFFTILVQEMLASKATPPLSPLRQVLSILSDRDNVSFFVVQDDKFVSRNTTEFTMYLQP